MGSSGNSTPQVLQTAAILKAASGESKTQIAKDLGLNRVTVHRILERAELDQIVAEGRSRAMQLIPLALDAAEFRLRKNDGMVAISVLKGTGVLNGENQGTNVAVQINVDAPRPQRT